MTVSPKARKAAQRARMRLQGLRPREVWATDAEWARVARYLKRIAAERKKDS